MVSFHHGIIEIFTVLVSYSLHPVVLIYCSVFGCALRPQCTIEHHRVSEKSSRGRS